MSQFRSTARHLAAGGAVAALALPLAGAFAGSAQAATTNHVEATATQIVYTGTDTANALTVTLAGNQLTFRDTDRITAGPGCTQFGLVSGRYQVSCTTIPGSGGGIKPFRVDAGGGDDSIVNSTSVGVRIDGGAGNDTLTGGTAGDLISDYSGANTLSGGPGSDTLLTDVATDTQPDVLNGGSGDDDLRAGPSADTLRGDSGTDFLRGGLGADLLDGGTGSGDAVVYLENAHDGKRVVVTLDGKPGDGFQPGGTNEENDNVLDSNEAVFGGTGNDVLFGNDKANRLVGNSGNDTLIGYLGADDLDGGLGDDTIAGNDLFGAPVADGAIDTLNGSAGSADYCRIPFAEADVTIGCETVDVD